MLAIRQANDGDIVPVARLFRAVRAACLPYLPELHTPEEDLAFFRDRVFKECEVWVAGAMDGFIACRAVPAGSIISTCGLSGSDTALALRCSRRHR